MNTADLQETPGVGLDPLRPLPALLWFVTTGSGGEQQNVVSYPSGGHSAGEPLISCRFAGQKGPGLVRAGFCGLRIP